MIGYACLIYIGVKIGAAWWYYLLCWFGVTCKFFGAVLKTAAEK